MYSKEFLLLTAIICVTVAVGNKISVKVSPQHVLKLRSISTDCAEKTGVDPGILPKVIDWTFDVDEQTKEYVYCLSVNASYVDVDGNINIPKMLELEILIGTQEDYIQNLNECNKIKEERNVDTVFKIGNCIKEFLDVNVVRPNS